MTKLFRWFRANFGRNKAIRDRARWEQRAIAYLDGLEKGFQKKR